VRPVLIVVDLVRAQDPPQMGLVPDECAVQELAADQDLGVFQVSSRRDSRSQEATRVVRRKTNRRHMIGDHHGRTSENATLLVRAADETLGTHSARTLVSRALVAIDEMHLDRAMALCAAGRDTFVVLSSKEDECWSLVVQSRIHAAMGSEEEASTALGAARILARELGRGDDFVDQFLADSGPDVR
jgi:hypothetical protein